GGVAEEEFRLDLDHLQVSTHQPAFLSEAPGDFGAPGARPVKATNASSRLRWSTRRSSATTCALARAPATVPRSCPLPVTSQRSSVTSTSVTSGSSARTLLSSG